MNISLRNLRLSGSLTIPPSKSMMQRACAAALLHNGTTIIHNPGSSEDERAALQIIQDLGAAISYADQILIIRSEGKIACQGGNIDCRESGLAARLFTPVAALSDKPVIIEGSGSLRVRPMNIFNRILPELGVQLSSSGACLPYVVCGPLQAKDIMIDGSLSSQFISGLLFAFSATAQQSCRIRVEGLVSKPYIDLTLEVLQHFGKKIVNNNYHELIIDPYSFTPQPDQIAFSIEGDWSSAAFWIAAAALRGPLSLQGLHPASMQADKAIISIMKSAGAIVEWTDTNLNITPGSLQAFLADLSDSPDLFPVLSVFAACCKGQSELKGLRRLVHKESNRMESICVLLQLLQVPFSVVEDSIFIEGVKRFPSVQYSAPNDHRMVMAAALAALHCDAIQIDNAEAVNKSYPSFWQQLQTISS